MFALMEAFSQLHWTRFDYAIIHVMNYSAHRSVVLDQFIDDLNVEMFSNLLVLTLVWYAWFKTDDNLRHGGLIAGVVLSLIAGFVSRGLQLGLPSHPRPLHDPTLGFRVPYTVVRESLNHWSSFPSDHAAVFFGLATAIWLAHRGAGRLAFLLVIVMNLARIYCGFHYPTDIISGAMIGVLGAYLGVRVGATDRVQRLLPKDKKHEALFYAACFYFCFGVTTLFNDYRNLVSTTVSAVRHGKPLISGTGAHEE
jgi:undecaprenyl-diphosphatase